MPVGAAASTTTGAACSSVPSGQPTETVRISGSAASAASSGVAACGSGPAASATPVSASRVIRASTGCTSALVRAPIVAATWASRASAVVTAALSPASRKPSTAMPSPNAKTRAKASRMVMVKLSRGRIIGPAPGLEPIGRSRSAVERLRQIVLRSKVLRYQDRIDSDIYRCLCRSPHALRKTVTQGLRGASRQGDNVACASCGDPTEPDHLACASRCLA